MCLVLLKTATDKVTNCEMSSEYENRAAIVEAFDVGWSARETDFRISEFSERPRSLNEKRLRCFRDLQRVLSLFWRKSTKIQQSPNEAWRRKWERTTRQSHKWKENLEPRACWLTTSWSVVSSKQLHCPATWSTKRLGWCDFSPIAKISGKTKKSTGIPESAEAWVIPRTKFPIIIMLLGVVRSEGGVMPLNFFEPEVSPKSIDMSMFWRYTIKPFKRLLSIWKPHQMFLTYM